MLRKRTINSLLSIAIIAVLIVTSFVGFVACGNDAQDGTTTKTPTTTTQDGTTTPTTTTQDGETGYADRLDTLEGKTICELSNDEWQAFRILPAVRNALEALYPTAEFVPFTEFPIGLVSMGKESTAEALAQRGCDCVVIANVG